jgi:predicted DNA-binding transcriptional regulator AlpA
MRLLTFTELQRQKGIPYCRDHLRRLVKAGQFPLPIVLGARRIAWSEDEVDAYLEKLVAKRNAAPEPEPDNKERKLPPRGRGGRSRAAQ